MKLVIGIDPGVKTGFAVKDIATNVYLRVDTLMIHEAFDAVRELMREGTQLYLVIEDARLRKWYDDKGKSASARRGKAMGAASVKRDCKAWEDFCEDYGLTYTMKAPRELTTKEPLHIWTRRTGWKRRTSEHARDAASFISGLNARNLKLQKFRNHA
jgi:hypothetical protein